MSKPIFKLFMFRNIEAFYQATEAERNEVLGKLNAAFEQVGGKRLLWCDSSWSNEAWPVFGVEEFPDIEAVQKYSRVIGELNLARYLESWSILGTKEED
ncbi:MAG TPA: hypothetical protein VGK00_15025 [Anaerolineales bacterium]|jgi:hypothetical protein